MGHKMLVVLKCSSPEITQKNIHCTGSEEYIFFPPVEMEPRPITMGNAGERLFRGKSGKTFRWLLCNLP